MEEKWLQGSYALIFKVRLLLRCAYLWMYTVDCAHPLVLNNGAPISWASSIMGTSDEATPYTWTLPSEMNGLRYSIGMGGQIPPLSSQTLSQAAR